MKLKSLFLGLMFCASQNVVVSQTNVTMPLESGVTSNIATEKAKWMYLKSHLTKNIHSAATVVNQCGELLQQHAIIPATVAPIIITGVYRELIGGGVIVGNDRQAMSYFAISAIASVGVYHLAKIIGRHMEDREHLCQHGLTLYLLYWENHKEHTPVALHTIFDELHSDFKKNRSITKMTQNEIKVFVEGLIEVSVIATTK
jgi:hypothetical protein